MGGQNSYLALSLSLSLSLPVPPSLGLCVDLERLYCAEHLCDLINTRALNCNQSKFLDQFYILFVLASELSTELYGDQTDPDTNEIQMVAAG